MGCSPFKYVEDVRLIIKRKIHTGVWLNRDVTYQWAHLKVVFLEQSYSSVHSGWNLAWDHFHGDIADPCGIIADSCCIIPDPCSVVAIPEAISSHTVADADPCATLLKHC